MMETISTRRAGFVLLLLGFAFPKAAVSQEEHGRILKEKFEAELQELAQGFDGVLGSQIIDLTDGTTFGVNAQLVFPQASAIKIPILVELFRQAERRPGLLREQRPVTASVQVGGSGVLRHLGDGSSALALEDHAVLMIVLSDNTATNVLIDELGMEAVNRTMAELGFSNTLLQRKMIHPDASARGEENLSSPRDAAALMALIHRCDLPVSQDACARIRAILEIPKRGPVREPVPSSVPIAFKPGGIEGVATVWALVGLPDRPYALAVMTNYGTNGNEAVRDVSSAAYEYFYRLARSTTFGARVPLEVIREHRVRRP
jgi:beta-lactamase class A